ncbi:MAG: phage tail sheath subtilisin-like domain-containing protein [Desulfobacteraceae bacterium]|nr:phage tail sheath subtilisin-like domain-containing protein [Desulfobacteraceae bacterium]
MTDPITFSELQVSNRKPGTYIELNTRNAVRGLPGNPQHLLIIAQRLAAGTVAEAIPTQVYSSDEAATYAGRGSAAHLMVKASIAANRYVDLTLCLLDDAAAGAAAVKTVTLTGPATGPGELRLFIGNQRIAVAVANEATAVVVAALLNTEIAKYTDLLYTAAVGEGASTHIITATCRHKGTVGNQVDITYECTAPGITVAIATATPGATDPDIQDALDAVLGETYELITTHINDATSAGALRDHLDTVSHGMEMRAGRGVLGYDGLLADAVTLADGINGGRVGLCYLRATRSPAYEIAAGCASAEAAPAFEDPAVPRRDVYIKGLHAPAIADRLSDSEMHTLLYSGVAPLVVGPGEKVQIKRFISTYTVNAEAVADPALLDFNTLAILDYGRKAIRQSLSNKFSNQKATARTLANVRSDIYATALRLEEAEIWENVEANKDGIVVIVDPNEPTRFRFRCPADVVNGLMQIFGVIDMIL